MMMYDMMYDIITCMISYIIYHILSYIISYHISYKIPTLLILAIYVDRTSQKLKLEIHKQGKGKGEHVRRVPSNFSPNPLELISEVSEPYDEPSWDIFEISPFSGQNRVN